MRFLDLEFTSSAEFLRKVASETESQKRARRRRISVATGTSFWVKTEPWNEENSRIEEKPWGLSRIPQGRWSSSRFFPFLGPWFSRPRLKATMLLPLSNGWGTWAMFESPMAWGVKAGKPWKVKWQQSWVLAQWQNQPFGPYQTPV